MGRYRYRSRSRRSRRSKPLGVAELIMLVAVVFGLGFVSFLSLNAQSLLQAGWILIGFFAVIAVVVIGVGIYSSIKRAQKWKLFKLADIDQMPGLEFEHYLAKLLTALGYDRVEVTQGSGDFGVDLLFKKDGIRYAAQVKRKKGYVGVDALYQAVGGRDFYRADQAMVITNSYFSHAAKKFADQSNVELIDREELATMIVEAQQLP